MANKEAKSRIKINKLLEESGWRLLDENGTIKWLVSGDIYKREIFDYIGRITESGMRNSNAKYLPINFVLIAING